MYIYILYIIGLLLRKAGPGGEQDSTHTLSDSQAPRAVGGAGEARGGGGGRGGARAQVTLNFAQSAGSLVPNKWALKLSGGGRVKLPGGGRVNSSGGGRVNSFGWHAQEGGKDRASETPHMAMAAAAADGAIAPSRPRSAGAQQPGVRGTGKGKTGDGRGDSAHSAHSAYAASRHGGLVGGRGVDEARARQARAQEAVASTTGVIKGLQTVEQGDNYFFNILFFLCLFYKNFCCEGRWNFFLIL
jgi:hypothetical protein